MFLFRNSHKRSDKTPKDSTSRTGKRRRASLFLEALEDRTLPSTVNWINPSGGDWDTGTNWSTLNVPGPGDDAVINTGTTATITIGSTGNESVNRLTTIGNDTLSIAGGSLTVAASSPLGGPLSIVDGSLTAMGAGAVLTATGTTTLSGSNLLAQEGATLSLPELTSYTAEANMFQADGTGSVLDVHALATVTQTTYLSIQATGGGEIKLSSLTSLAGVYDSQIIDTGGSTILDPKLTSLDTTLVTLDGTDSQVANGWTTFTNGNLYVTSGSENLSSLTDADGSSLYAQSGGSLALPGLTSYTAEGNTFQADGAHSQLDVSALAKVTQTGYLSVQATGGGEIKLSSLTSLAGVYDSQIIDTGGSTILDAKLISLDSTSVTFDGTDSQVANAWTTFTNGNLNVTGSLNNLSNLINASGSNIAIDSGGSLRVPANTTGGTYTVVPTSTLIVGSDNVTPTSLTVPAAYAADNWAGTFSGTASDASGTGLASVGVSLFDGSHYFDGTAFESTTPVYLPTTLSGTDWTITIPVADFSSNVSYSVVSRALDNGGGVESSTINSLVLTQPPPVLTSVSPAQGLVGGGTTVTITGTYVSQVVAVDFGAGNPGSVVSGTPGTLVVTSPPGSVGTIDIIVTTSQGASAPSDDDHFTYLVAPIVTMTAPVNGNMSNVNKPTLKASASDTGGSGLASVQFEYSSNGGTTWTNAGAAETSGPFSFTFATALADGSYEARAVATDDLGYSTTSSAVSFTIDTVAPTIAMTAPVNGIDTNVNKPTLTATASDNTGGTGLASVQFEYSSNGGTTWNNAGSTETAAPFTFPFATALSDGTYEARAVATDNVGNSTTSPTVSFTIDTVAPTVSMTAPANGGDSNNNKPTLAATAADNTGGTGLASVQFEYSNNGGTNWTNAGTAETSGPFSFTFATALADGAYEARAVATDNASNSTTSTVVSFTIDTVAPTVAMTAPVNGIDTNVNKPALTATASDNTGGSGLASVQFEYSSDGGTTWNNAGAAETGGPFSFSFTTALADGSYEARAVATDNASNSATSSVVSFTIDTVAPTVAMTAPVNGSDSNVNKPMLTATASDNTGGSGLASVQFEYSSNGGTSWNNAGSPETAAPFSFSFTTALADGTYEARAVATDNASNSATSSVVSFTIDTVAPTVSMTAPADGSSINVNKPTLTATASDTTGGSGLASVQFEYSSDGGTTWTNAGAAQTNAPFSFTFATALADGSYETRAVASDNASNTTNSSAVTFTIDTVAPTVSMTAPTNGNGSNNTKPTLTATASDNAGGSGLASVQFEYSSNGGTSWNNAGSPETAAPFSFSFTTALADGSYEARAVATDNAGNSTTSSAVSFAIDTVAPTVSMTAPTNGSNSSNTKPTLTATASDNAGGSGLASVQFEYSSNGGASWTNAGAAESSGPFSFTFTTTLASGTYEARAVATDNVGNSATSTPVFFGINVVQVSPTLSTVPGGTVALGSVSKLTDSATLSKGSNPSGTITFTLYAPDGKTVVDTETAMVNGNGTYKTPTGYLPVAVGTYQWVAGYSGDGANKTVTSTKAAEKVTVASPTISSTPGGNVVLGSQTRVTDSATLSGGFNPSGKIVFVLDAPNGRSVDTESVTVTGNGTYSTPTGYLPSSTAGTYQWVVSYSGDSNNKAASSSLGKAPVTVIGTGVTVVGKALYLVGGSGDDRIQMAATGSSATGSTGVTINASLNGVVVAKAYSQSFTTINVFGFGGNDSIQAAGSLTVNTVVSEGDGNDYVQLGGGNNSVTLGNGNDSVTLGNGSNMVVSGNGNDIILSGNGNNLIAAGLGQHTVVAGNGSNILIDGSVQLTKSGDTLAAVLNDWTLSGGLAANVAGIRSRLAVTDNASDANTLVAGSGLDWFFETFGKDTTNKTATDLLN